MAGSPMRLSGINSGFDTAAMIKQMMSTYQLKIDRQNKKLQTLMWKQEQYRDITSKLSSFKNKYFDILKRDTYLMSPSSFSKFKSTITTKSGKESGLKVTTDSKSVEGTHTVKVQQLATAATRKGESIASEGFKLDIDRALKNSDADENGNYNFSLDVKVGSVSKTVEFSGADKDSILADLNSKLAKSFGAASGSDWFVQAKVNPDGKFGLVTGGNAAVTVTEKTGDFGLAKPATRVAIDPAAALTGTSSISVTFANHYTGEPVTKNISFATVSSTYFDGKDTDDNVKQAFLNLKKAAYRKANGLAADAEVTEKEMYEAKFRYSSADAAYDLNSQTLTSALNKAFAMEQGVSFKLDGSSMTAKFIDGSAVEFTMTSTCDATFGLQKGSATNSIADNTKLSALGIQQNKTVEPDYTLPNSFKLDLTRAMNKATADGDGNYNFALDFTVGGVSKTIEFSGSNTNSILSSLNKGLKESFGDSGLRAVNNGDGTLGFKTDSGDSITISENVGSFGLVTLSDKVAFNPGDLEEQPTNAHAISFTVNGADGKPLTTTINFSGLVTPNDFDPEDEWDVTFINLKEDAYRKANGLDDSDAIDEDDLAAFEYTATDAARDFNLQNKDFIGTLNSSFTDQGITFEYEDGFLTAKDAEGNPVKFGVDSEDGNIGRAPGSISHTFENTGTTYEGYSMTINGKEISVGANATISDLISAVNKSGAGVTMEYSKLESRFILTAKDKGAGGQIEITGNTELADALGLMGVETVAGQNAKITLDGVEIYHNDNTYEMDGIKCDFSDVTPDENETITVSVGKDYTDIKQTIKDFVSDYNKMIDEITGYTKTSRPMDKDKNYYDPLTDEEKEEMSEKEIEKWEEQAKKGLLHNDPTVATVMNRIRSVLYTTVETDNGGKFGLFNMGIRTASYLTGSPEDARLGKLTIDEEQLDKAFDQYADEIVKLFTDNNGVMQKVNKAIESAVKETGDSRTQGTLIRKAGSEKGTSAKTNAIYKEMERINRQIERLQKRYDQKEEYWWKVFTNLEKMQAQFDSQQSYITQFNANGGSLGQ
ncbi:MAG: flagellar filament capping protein FliD [Oscillospiraceae bacterium]|nr:flagellar filament capping protein FliD [Oscillospiraceae bacterium]